MRITQITTAISEYYTLDILRHIEVNKGPSMRKASSFNNFLRRTFERKEIQVPEGWFNLWSMSLASINMHVKR